MNITELVIGGRDEALLTGDYKSYREHLSRKLLAIRRRLKLTTGKNAKYQRKPAVTAEQLASDAEYGHLLLFTAERAWAHAMHMKSIKSEESTGRSISGPTRDHILARLSKASKIASEFYAVLRESHGSANPNKDLVEARAFLGLMRGSLEFEKQSEGIKTKDQIAQKDRWHLCLREYSVARLVYAALHKESKREMFKDLLGNTIDPTIRYAAYQAKLSRTIAVSSAALRFFPEDETEVAGIIKQIEPEAFAEHKPVKDQKAAAAAGEAPSSISWRGRTANVVDASIGSALGQAAIAEKRLADFMSQNPGAPLAKKANAYDEILIAWQDAADANRRATEELEKEGADEGDSRMQDLRVSNLAINYDIVSWRVGRNRVLIGEDDGRAFHEQTSRPPKRPRRDGKPWAEREEARSRKLGRLRERVVLYDSTIQSIDSIKTMRGAARDPDFVAELDGKKAYFQALKCLNIAISYSLLLDPLKALALLSRAGQLSHQAVSTLSPSTRSAKLPPTLDIGVDRAEALHKQLKAQIIRHQAIANMHRIETDTATASKKTRTFARPLVERINEYPEPGLTVDLSNLVSYPPKVEPIPVKPLFFDVAFNYLDYPGRRKPPVGEKLPATNGIPAAETARTEEKKRGWFGFGR